MKALHGWRIVPLSDIAARKPNAIVDGPFGSNLKLSDYVEDGVPVLQGKNITGNRFEWFDIRFVSEEKANALRRSLVRVGDILIVKIGSIGYSAILDDLHGYPYALIPANLCKVTPDLSVIDRDYLAYYLTSEQSVKYLKANASATSQPALSLSKVKRLPVPLPPLLEQKHIAAILAKADRLRRLRRTARELNDTYLQSVFLEMFGDPVSNPMGWETLDFGKVISIISGHGFKKAEYSNKGVRLLQIANVSFQEILWDTLAYLPPDYIERYPKLVLKPGDLLMALNRPILGHRVKFAVLKEEDCPAILYQRVGKFVIESEKLDRDYLYGFMLTDYYFRELEVRLAGSDQPYINPTELVKMRFLLPPLPLQQQFAHIVHKFERLRAQQREAGRQAEHLFQTLLHRAFRGEV